MENVRKYACERDPFRELEAASMPVPAFTLHIPPRTGSYT